MAHLQMSRRGPRSRGFTLIEAVVVIVVLMLLATAALPSFVESMRKSRRADAIARLQAVQQAQERYRADHPRYAAGLAELGLPAATGDGLYTVAIDSADAVGYTASASVVAGSRQADDHRCRALRVSMAGAQTTLSSVDAQGVESGLEIGCGSRNIPAAIERGESEAAVIEGDAGEAVPQGLDLMPPLV